MVPYEFNDEWNSFIAAVTNNTYARNAGSTKSCATVASCGPQVSLTANGQPQTTIMPGKTVKLAWAVTDNMSQNFTCTASNNNNGGWPNTSTGSAWTSGSQTITPPYNSSGQTTVTYTLSCTDSSGYTGTATATVTTDPQGACGTDSGQSFSSLTQDDSNLCGTYDTLKTDSFTGPSATGWSWSCTPYFAGDTATVPCSASGVCASSNIANSTVTGAFPGCDITCDSGYHWSDSTHTSCVLAATIIKECGISAGCHNSGNGVICPCLCSWYYSSGGSLTPYNPDPVPTNGFTLESSCTLQGVCGSNVTVTGSTGATSGDLCTVGHPSTVSKTDGSYTCTPTVSGVDVMDGYQAAPASCTATVVSAPAPVCGTDVVVNGTSSPGYSGTLCTSGTSSDATFAEEGSAFSEHGTYTCTNGTTSVSCQATVMPICNRLERFGHWCFSGYMENLGGCHPLTWHCRGTNSDGSAGSDSMCALYGINPRCVD